MNNAVLTDLTSDIVRAHLSNNRVAAADVASVIQSVYSALVSAGKKPDVHVPREPAVPVRSSVKPGSIACLECGAKLKTLKRHLSSAHGLNAEDYRARWSLSPSYPLTSADYSEARRQTAKKVGLGRKPTKTPAGAHGPASKPSVRKKLSLSF